MTLLLLGLAPTLIHLSKAQLLWLCLTSSYYHAKPLTYLLNFPICWQVSTLHLYLHASPILRTFNIGHTTLRWSMRGSVCDPHLLDKLWVGSGTAGWVRYSSLSTGHRWYKACKWDTLGLCAMTRELGQAWCNPNQVYRHSLPFKFWL